LILHKFKKVDTNVSPFFISIFLGLFIVFRNLPLLYFLSWFKLYENKENCYY